jgi:hypothetical protein
MEEMNFTIFTTEECQAIRHGARCHADMLRDKLTLYVPPKMLPAVCRFVFRAMCDAMQYAVAKDRERQRQAAEDPPTQQQTPCA